MASNVVMPKDVADSTGRQYQISDKLGKGGFAVCYRTEVNGQLLALKVSRTSEMNEKLRDKLITELQIHSKVRHPNIVQFYRSFSVIENTFIALELCTNGTLKEMLANRSRISMPETRRFALQLCGALHYLHSRRVIHRDIKTANILLDDQMNIKLADFGLAAVLVTDEEMGEVKRRVTVCGTPNYIAPEILHKKRGHDTKADIWSLGVLFYNMLTGRMPFSKPEDKGHDAVFKRVAVGAFSWPEDATKTISPAALDLVDGMLQTEDIERPEAIEVANHDFFKLGAIPAKLEPSFVRTRPTWLKKTDPQDMRMNAKTISHESMLLACGLIDVSASRIPLAEIGQEYEQSRPSNDSQLKVPLSHLLLHEFNQGLVPTLPLKGVYEPMEWSHQGAFRVKPKKAQQSAKSTISRKEGTKVKSGENGPFQLTGPNDGILLGPSNVDLKLTVTNVYNIMKGRTLDIKKPSSGLPPLVLHSLETEKWGLGYVLADGSIGLLSERRMPEKAVMISHGIQHFKQYTEPREAPTLPAEVPVYMYEKDANATAVSSSSSMAAQIKLFTDSTRNYPIVESSSSTSSTKYKLDTSSSDPFQLERGRALSLWSRYATYLAAKIRIEDLDVTSSPVSPEVYLAMWQVIGNVQVWYWIGNPACDQAGYEFEFADKTKLALSSDGSEVRFTYDADAGTSTATTPTRAFSRLETLELPLLTLLGCSAKKNPLIWRTLELNHFMPKLEFIRDVFLMWLANKGVGKYGTQKMAYRGPLVGLANQDDEVEVLKYCDLIL